jgi:hypothetical protein
VKWYQEYIEELEEEVESLRADDSGQLFNEEQMQDALIVTIQYAILKMPDGSLKAIQFQQLPSRDAKLDIKQTEPPSEREIVVGGDACPECHFEGGHYPGCSKLNEEGDDDGS